MRYAGHPAAERMEVCAVAAMGTWVTMRIGSSIILIALGLILALAVSVNVRGIDLTLVGWILTAVGVLGLIISLVLYRRNRSVVAPARDPYGPRADPYSPERDPRY